MDSMLKVMRQRQETRLTRMGLAHTFSLARYRLHKCLVPLIREHAHGDALDAGSGHAPFKQPLTLQCESVTCVDIEDRAGEIDFVADLQAMPHVADGSYDFVLCSQVLEHVPRPWDAAGELSRVLRPGGVLVLTVPHLSAIHEAPHDYYRYTPYALRALSERSGLDVVSIQPSGGLWCFLLHPISYVWMTTVGSLPWIGWLGWLLNYLLLIVIGGLVDRLIGVVNQYPCDHIMVARKVDKKH